MHAILRDLSPKTYNRLPDVDSASEFVHANGLLEVMASSIGTLLVRHQLHHHWAVSLLHNHWDIRDDEAPIEHVSLEADGTKVYTMQPMHRNSLGSCGAGLISISGDILQALEFSSDPTALEANELLLGKPDAVSDLIEAFRDTGLQQHFGLAPALDTPRPGYELVESNLPGRISVTKETLTGSVDSDMLVQTAWMFDDSGASWCRKTCVPVGGNHHVKSDHYSPDD